MAERWGPRRIDEIEKEPPKEAPVHTPGDATGLPTDQPGDNTTPPEIGEDLGNLEEDMDKGKYTEVIQDGYGKATRDTLGGGLYDIGQQDALEKEGAHIMAETEALGGGGDPAKIEAAEKYLTDLESRLYEPSDTLSGGGDNIPDTPSDVIDDTPSDVGDDIGDDI